MVSYKQMYEEMKTKYEKQMEFINKKHETDYLCPLCNSKIEHTLDEYVCSNENCKFDKTAGELFFFYAENNQLERSD